MTTTTPNTVGDPLDVWLKFEDSEDSDNEMATYEANTYRTTTGYVVEWYHNSVGLVKALKFDTLEDVHAWYEREGFEDYSS